MAVGQELFSQASTQVNLLLLSQRNMVLVSAFAITLVSFAPNFKYNYVKYLAILLFIFGIASGSKSVQDFNAYIKDTLENDSGDPAEKELLDRWAKWADYSYFMLAIISFIFLNVLIIEWTEFAGYGVFWEKQNEKRKKKLKT